jgi:hypothetical protein
MLVRLALKILPLLLMSLAGCHASNAAAPAADPVPLPEPGVPVAFRASSLENEFFAFVGVFEGTYTVRAEGLDVFIRRATVQLRGKGGDDGPRHLRALTLGLGYGEVARRWGMRTRSQPVRIDRVMVPGDEVTLDSLHGFVPSDHTGEALRRTWIIFEMESLRTGPDAPPGATGTSYAHAPRLDGSAP